MKTAVIGGGWAGLAAAVELTAAGHQTTLFEAGRVAGGRARSVDIDGRRLDNGQHILLGAYRETLGLMRRVGADPDRLFDRRPLQIIDRNGFHLALPRLPAPFHVAWGLFAARGITLAEKLRTAWWMEGIKARRFQLDADVTVSQWLDAAGQTGRLRRHLWEPLCLAALNTPAHLASAQHFANVLRDSLGSPRRADTDLLIPKVNFGQLLPEPALVWLSAHGAEIRLGRRVEKLRPTPSGVDIDGQPFDAAVIATAPQHATRLWPDMSASYDFEPIATVYLQFDRHTRLDFPLLNLDSRIGQWVVDRGNGLLACVLSGHGEWEALDDTGLADILQKDLGLSGQANWHKVIREKRATFSCRPGIARPGETTTHPRIRLAGDYTFAEYPATLEGAVRSGLRAARSLGTAAPTW
ncbi:MAG: FAD-dependent oxidoreductase [Rhodocyclales bacterium GT-UBC]|nr:MAG: FAD-dependent oxidoreductase [Rhodocyclales bacterium GT-UBC]